MDEVVEALEKYQGLVPLVYDVETMGLAEARPQDMPYAVYLKREADKVIAELKAQKAQAEDDCAYWKAKAQRERHHKYKRCLLYAKNHKNLGDLATDTARLIGLNAYAFTKETETACVAYWNRIRDCHYRRHDEWLELAEKFKDKEAK